jgi:hypothetical protein
MLDEFGQLIFFLFTLFIIVISGSFSIIEIKVFLL